MASRVGLKTPSFPPQKNPKPKRPFKKSSLVPKRPSTSKNPKSSLKGRVKKTSKPLKSLPQIEEARGPDKPMNPEQEKVAPNSISLSNRDFCRFSQEKDLWEFSLDRFNQKIQEFKKTPITQLILHRSDISDQDLIRVTHALQKSLIELCLTECPNITLFYKVPEEKEEKQAEKTPKKPQGVHGFLFYPESLKQLCLSHCSKISEETLKLFISRLLDDTKVARIDFRKTAFSERCLACFKGFKGHIQISKNGITKEAIEIFKTNNPFASLFLEEDMDIPELISLSDLCSFIKEGWVFSKDKWEAFTKSEKFKNVENLQFVLPRMEISNEDLASIVESDFGKKAISWNLAYCRGPTELPPFSKGVVSINLSGWKIPKDSLKIFPTKLENLRYLTLINATIPEGELKSLSNVFQGISTLLMHLKREEEAESKSLTIYLKSSEKIPPNLHETLKIQFIPCKPHY